VKKSVKKDKKNYIKKLASQAENVAIQGNLKDLYPTTKKTGRQVPADQQASENKDDNSLKSTEEQLKREAEHFRELLYRPAPEPPPDIPLAETELPINCDKPSKAEIRKVIATSKNGKAAGPDIIPAGAIKADRETVNTILHNLFSEILEKEDLQSGTRDLSSSYQERQPQALQQLLRHYAPLSAG
jgi:hypothetical protein